ncbi:MAG: HAD-IC family P-type ATPase, partial [Polyangiaceae bacterium]|nr:HAD-IC family P-type ATPase [Polyangiaceae bacterium]
ESISLAKPTNFVAHPGFGISGTVDNHHIDIGNTKLMSKIDVDTLQLQHIHTELALQGKTPLFLSINHTLAAVLAIADPIKLSTADAIKYIKQMGLGVTMITGDNSATAKIIAAQCGIDSFLSDQLPDQKLDAIKQIRNSTQGKSSIAYVGDGINDAPALSESDVGIAIGTGTDVAIESADIVLMSDDLMGVAQSIELSRLTTRNIRQNLFWAFAYNTALIPIAAGTLYPSFGILLSPVLAAGAMSLSSLFVLGNALRLQRFRPQRFQRPVR